MLSISEVPSRGTDHVTNLPCRFCLHAGTQRDIQGNPLIHIEFQQEGKTTELSVPYFQHRIPARKGQP